MEDYTFEYTSLMPKWTHIFPATGGGTVNISEKISSPFCIMIRPKTTPGRQYQNEWISLEIGKDRACFKVHIHEDTHLLVGRKGTTQRGETVGYQDSHKITYWLSYNCNCLVLKYGKGYHMSETTILEYDFLEGLSPKEQKETRSKLRNLFGPEVTRVVEHYDCQLPQSSKYYVQAHARELVTLQEPRTKPHTVIETEDRVEFSPIPLTCNWPPIVLDSSKCTLLELDSNNYTLSACLPSACKQLYQNIAQPQMSLDWTPSHHADKVKLSDAIRYSLENTDGLLYKKLEEKAGIFGLSNKQRTYLRITLGCDRGNSPGIPYVLEIWPKGHYSPIHSHGNSYAVIKVLHGGVTAHIYNKHTDHNSGTELLQFDLREGDITWISPNWYQTHKLWNKTNDYCATIQCYQYGEGDYVRWPYFDYVASDGEVCQFVPNSDFTFRDMRERVLREYKTHMIGRTGKI